MGHTPPHASRPSSGPQRRRGTPGEGRGPAVRGNTPACGHLERPRSGRGPGRCARARNPTRPPRPPASFLPRQSTPEVNPHTTGRRQNGSPSAAGRRTRHRPKPTAIAHTARAHPPEGSTGRALAGPGGRPSPRGRGASRLTRPPRTPHRRAPSGPTRGHRGGDRRRGRWGRERHTTARPRAPEGQPGALQEHRKGPSGADARAHPPRGQHDGPAGRHPPPPRRGAARKSTTTGGDSEGCLPRQRTPPTRPATQKAAGGTARSGRAPHPTRLPHTRHPQAGRGETRGPRGAEREERSRSPRTSAPRPSRLGPGPGEHDVTTSITKSPPGAEVGRPAGRRPAPGKGRRTTQRRRERLTRTARSQRGGVVAAAPGARSGERTGAGWPSPPSPPPPGGSETRTRAGTGSRDTPGRARGQQARGPQQAAQAGARPASRVTGRPEPRTHPESQPLQRQVARGQRVSNNPVAQDADSE